MRGFAERLVEARWFQGLVITAIILNAITLGLETWPRAMDRAGDLLRALDRAFLSLFVVEIGLKLFAYRLAFFKKGWNVFDFIIVGVALLPSSGAFSVLRALRILRVLRLLSVVPSLRAVIEALFRAVPGMGAIVGVLGLLFYVAAVIATKLYGGHFPEWFGSIGRSMYTLFQVMTLESWSMGIVRPVMEVEPLAWVFFVPFVIVTSFAVLNLFIGIIVNSLQELHAQEKADERAALAEITKAEADHLMEEIRALRDEVRSLRDGGDGRR